MDLISKTALLNDLCEDREEGTFCFTDSQAEAADKIIVYVTKRINAQIPISAVPLDKLCEWLAGYAEPPLDALTICDNPFEAWKMTLTKWMEEQDAKEKN